MFRSILIAAVLVLVFGTPRAHADVRFELPMPSPTGGWDRVLAEADFDADGLPDVAIGSHLSQEIRIFYGGGRVTAIPIAGQPSNLTSADIDGDGDVDLLFTIDASDLQVLLREADGTYSQRVVPDRGGNRIAVADIAGNSLPDLVVFDWYRLRVFRNEWNLDFALVDTWPEEEWIIGPAELLVADFDGDDDPDVLYVGNVDMPVRGAFFVVLFRGVQAPVPQIEQYEIGSEVYPECASAADIDGNGLPEFLIGWADGILIHHDIGQHFAFANALDDDGANQAITLGRETAAGELDLFVGQGPALKVWHGTGNLQFDPPVAHPQPAPVTALGFAGDGSLHVVRHFESVGEPGLLTLPFVEGHLVYDLPPPVELTDDVAPRHGWEDFDGDGFADLLTETPGAVVLWRGAGDGTFAGATELPLPPGGAASPFRMDDDPLGDVAVVEGTVLHLYRNLGSWSFAPPLDLPLDLTPTEIEAVPGVSAPQELLLRDGTAVARVFPAGGGGFQAVRSFLYGGEPAHVEVGETDGDPGPELVVADPEFYCVRIFDFAPDGTIEQLSSLPTGFPPADWAAPADFFADGERSIAVHLPVFGRIDIYSLSGELQTSMDAGYGTRMLVADVTGSGPSLLLLYFPFEDLLRVYRAETTQPLTFTHVDYEIETNFFAWSLADLRGDAWRELALLSGNQPSKLHVVRTVPYGNTSHVEGAPVGLPSLAGLRIVPNPASGPVRVELAPQTDRAGGGVLTVFDATGRLVRRLAHGGGDLRWDGRDPRGTPMPPGVYLLRWDAPAGARSAKLVRLPG